VTTYGEGALAEDDDVHVERLEVGRTVGILLEGAEADEVVVAEEFDLLARLLHLDILRGEGMDAENLFGEGEREVSMARAKKEDDRNSPC
jgi:hypothetical protein